MPAARRRYAGKALSRVRIEEPSVKAATTATCLSRGRTICYISGTVATQWANPCVDDPGPALLAQRSAPLVLVLGEPGFEPDVLTYKAGAPGL
jgi:hypothetical protein